MNNIIETIQGKHVTGEILPDMDGESPRENDNLGTMVYWHPRIILGDEHPRHAFIPGLPMIRPNVFVVVNVEQF